MKKIPKPELKSATVMTPFDMNKVPFSKTRTVLTPEQLEIIAKGGSTDTGSKTDSVLSSGTSVSGSVTNLATGASDITITPGASDPIPKMGASDPVRKPDNSSATVIK